MKSRLVLLSVCAAALSPGLSALRAQTIGISSITTNVNYGSGQTNQTINGSTVSFYNADVAVSSITDMNGNQYSVSGVATTAITRTDSTSTGEVNQASAWYMGNAQTSSGAAPSLLYGSYNSGTPGSLLLGNNLLEGADNVFINSSNAAAESNVERLDFLYNGTSGVAANNLAIGVFDRGVGDAFAVAVITGVDKNGNPTSYGAFVTVSQNAFTGGDLLTSANSNAAVMNSTNSQPTDYLVRYDSSTSLATGNVTNDTEINNQNIQGVVFTLASLGITSSTTVYGYSLMGGDVTPGTNLNSLTNYSNTAVYKTNTADSGSAFNGLDPVAVNGVMFSLKPVPEPSTYAEVFLVGALALYGWRRQRSARAQRPKNAICPIAAALTQR